MMDVLVDNKHQDRYGFKHGKNECEIVNKVTKEGSNKDIELNGKAYRISAKEEWTREETRAEAAPKLVKDKDKIKAIRIKHRNSFEYKFMEISLTHVVQIEDPDKDSDF